MKGWLRLVAPCVALTLLKGLGPLPAAGQDQTFAASRCSYFNIDSGKTLDGPCLLRTTTVNGNFGYVLTFGDGTRVTVEYVSAQSGYHIWKINGQSAFGVEINRQSLKGATLDLKQIIEWDSSARGAR
jgi:hypothetical protein